MRSHFKKCSEEGEKMKDYCTEILIYWQVKGEDMSLVGIKNNLIRP